MRLARLTCVFVLWAALGAGAALLALVTVPRALGLTPFTVLSGSMEPRLAVGDVVLDRHVAPSAVRPGDIVTFPDASRGGALVTHRVVSLRRSGANVAFVTRGDANRATESWAVPADGTIGHVVLRIPAAGWVLQWASSREGRLGLIAVPAGLLVLLELGALRGLRRRPQEAPA